MNELNGELIDLSAAAPVPEGRPICAVIIRGSGTQIVVEEFEEFCARFSAFMNVEHDRGDLFRFDTVYSWQATVDKLTQMHIVVRPGAWTVDGCQDVQSINPEFLKIESLEVKRDSPIVRSQQFPVHGPGKRRR
jgi:hypothetical protein